MRRVDDALPTAVGLSCHLAARLADPDAAGADHDHDALADQPPRHAVAVAVDLGTAVFTAASIS
jgi:hypothetical protein